MQGEATNSNDDAKFVIDWIRETVALSHGKALHDSWIMNGGFKLRSEGQFMIERLPYTKIKPSSQTETLEYIAVQNLMGIQPSFEQISSSLFNTDFTKTISVLTALITFFKIQYIPLKSAATEQ